MTEQVVTVEETKTQIKKNTPFEYSRHTVWSTKRARATYRREPASTKRSQSFRKWFRGLYFDGHTNFGKGSHKLQEIVGLKEKVSVPKAEKPRAVEAPPAPIKRPGRR